MNPVNIKAPGSKKTNVKSTTEFISIAYSDLYGTTVSEKQLVKLNTAYASFGDNKLIEDMIVRNLINGSGVKVPTNAEMRADVPAFVQNSYKKFLLREPNEFEKWYAENKIRTDSTITPVLVYYVFLTSNEYRYY